MSTPPLSDVPTSSPLMPARPTNAARRELERPPSSFARERRRARGAQQKERRQDAEHERTDAAAEVRRARADVIEQPAAHDVRQDAAEPDADRGEQSLSG